MEPKTKLGKSKSSNSAMTSRPDKETDKKSKSNAHFQIRELKKRGVYVEKKPTKISINIEETNPVQTKKQTKPPPRPRPGQKKFLASVLTILAKSTTGTQFPDEDDKARKKFNKTKSLKKKKEDVMEIEKDKHGDVDTIKKKQKYKSKVLNETLKNRNKEKVFVLQSKKDIIQTPSNYSEKGSYGAAESVKWSDIPKTSKDNTVADAIQLNVYNNVPEGILKEVLEGKKIKNESKDNKDPQTLVAEDEKKEKGLYNLFVDLLETTFSVYNVKTEYPSSEVSSVKNALEMDEKVVKKLTIKESPETFDDVTQKPSKHYKDDEEQRDHFEIFDDRPSRLQRPTIKRKSRSFYYPTPKTPLPKSRSITEKKSFTKKSKKQNLLNILKQELQMDVQTFEEPQNLYEALKLMARNKRKCEKTVQDTRIDDYKDDECIMKRRKVISMRTKPKRKKHVNIPESPLYSEPEEVTEDFGVESSYQSLEVLGFDYEPPRDNKKILYTRYKSPSISEKLSASTVLGLSNSETISQFSFS